MSNSIKDSSAENTLDTARSRELFARALDLLPGGVDSPVRAFRAVGGDPLFIRRGAGAYLEDVDGNRYIDYMLSWGPLILGHAPAAVVRAVCETAANGTSFGAPSPLELELAGLVRETYPSMQLLRFVSSGTEATMSAIRLARAFTRRSKLLKFEGCYHGHADSLLVKAGSGVATLALPDSPGVPPGAVADTLVAPFNSLTTVETLLERNKDQVAAIIVEPVVGNMGVVPPAPDFLPGLRELTRTHGALLIFDEVMTGYRVHPAGAQSLYDIRPDLTTLGKVIGGGLPVGAYGGRRDIMQMVAPAGPMYQAGTLSGNPLAMAAGIAALRELAQPGVWDGIHERTQQLAQGLRSAAARAGVPALVQQVGTMLTLFFTASEAITSWDTARGCDTGRYGSFFRRMLQQGVYLPPSQFEAAFLSSEHGEAEVTRTIEAADIALRT
jgi:glutamate-1-semialdehyde 2,1-aminomutase